MKNTAKSINDLDLKEMEGSLLAFAIMNEVEGNPLFNSAKVREALELAAYLHRKDTRANRANLPRDTYITHPYRNTLRILRYGCYNHDIIVACILHDTVEDHAREIVEEFTTKNPDDYDEQGLMDVSFDYIATTFGTEVARIVKAVSNLPLAKGLTKQQKRVEYAKHVLSVIHDGPVFLVKFSDFVDNAVGLYHNTGKPEMVAHLSQKYLLLVDGFDARLQQEELNPVLMLSKEGLAEMRGHLNSGKKRLVKLNKKYFELVQK